MLTNVRRAATALVMAGMLFAMIPAPGAAAGDTFDWVMLTIPVAVEVKALSLGVFMVGTTDADHVPFGLAMGFPGTTWPSHSYGFDVPGQNGQYGGVAAGVALRGLVNERVSVGIERETNTYLSTVAAEFGGYPRAEPRTFHLVVFAPGVGASSFTTKVLAFNSTTEVWDDLRPITTMTKGPGATAVRVSDLTAGFGVSAGPAGTGVGTAAITLPTGIVGSQTFGCLGSCETKYHTPDGRTDTWVQSGMTPYYGTTSHQTHAIFTGPAGAWSWDWSGSQQGDTFALYAPVGDAWQYFR